MNGFSNSSTLKNPGYFENAESSVIIALNNASMEKNMSYKRVVLLIVVLIAFTST